MQDQRQNLIATRAHGLPVNSKAEKAWNRIKKRTRARGFVFGRITERFVGQSTYILESNALVSTPPVQLEIQKGLDQDFGRIWTHRIDIEEKAEFVGFPLTADLMFIPVAYIMGIAALMSRDVFTGLRFHESLMLQTNRLVGIPEVAEVRKKL